MQNVAIISFFWRGGGGGVIKICLFIFQRHKNNRNCPKQRTRAGGVMNMTRKQVKAAEKQHKKCLHRQGVTKR